MYCFIFQFSGCNDNYKILFQEGTVAQPDVFKCPDKNYPTFRLTSANELTITYSKNKAKDKGLLFSFYWEEYIPECEKDKKSKSASNMYR